MLWKRKILNPGGAVARLNNGTRNVTAHLAVVVAYVAAASVPTLADFTFGEATNLGPTVNSSSQDTSPCISSDGLSLYSQSNRPGGSGSYDIWVTTRETVDDLWGKPVNLGPTVNSADWDLMPSVTADGLTLYFSSTRPGGHGDIDTWVTTRASISEPWGTPVNLGPTVNTSSEDAGAISADGLSLVIASNRPGGRGGQDFWISTRPTLLDPWSEPVNLGPTVNSSVWDWEGTLSPDNRILFFTSQNSVFGGDDLWLCARRATGDPWSEPVNLGPAVNSSSHDDVPCVSFDGSMLYFCSNRPGGVGSLDLYQAPILPVVDLSGDGRVDGADVRTMVENWGTSDSLCDIGPFPWGDGVVDEKDLKVLLKHLTEVDAITPALDALDVPCDIILSWIAPSSVPACDVYLGTSSEAVNTADRANPQGVLVSQGQTATTYDPEGILELSQTYFWRVDFVSPDAAPVIYRGPVLEFTTAALTYPIENVTATASSAQAGSGPENTVDGAGLDKTDGHSTDQGDMWWSMAEPSHWIQYEFDKVYTLHEMWVWNFNMMIEPLMGFGAKTVKIEYSTDGTKWTLLADVPEFARAPGQAGYTANTIVSFAAVPAKFVKLTIEKNWGVAPQTGLSEVRFFAIQSAAAANP